LWSRCRRRDSRLALTRVINVVPRDVQEERLHGDWLDLWGVGNEVVEVKGVAGVFVEAFHERPLAG
jgi:hypothetical protein